MALIHRLTELLTCAAESVEPSVCRSFINPGGEAPHDNCESCGDENGQVWVGHLGTTPGWPSPTGEPTTCATAWADEIEIGIVRCAQGKVQDDGTPPHEDDVTADAQTQEADRVALRDAILCCLGVDSKDLVVVGWEPISPQGGCVGGIWTILVRDGGCNC